MLDKNILELADYEINDKVNYLLYQLNNVDEDEDLIEQHRKEFDRWLLVQIAISKILKIQEIIEDYKEDIADCDEDNKEEYKISYMNDSFNQICKIIDSKY